MAHIVLNGTAVLAKAARRREPGRRTAQPALPVAWRFALLGTLLAPMLARLFEDLSPQLLWSPVAGGWMILAVLALLPLVLRRTWQGWRRWRRNCRCLAAVRTAYLAHADKLALNRVRLLHADEYGIEDPSRWHAHLGRFVSKVVLPLVRSADRAFFVEHFRESAIRLLDEAARQKRLEQIMPGRSGGRITGSDFERYCLDELRKGRWRARPTGASGDQGADIVAELQGRAVVFQCKFHAAPIGNKAVQEVAAARHHYRADAACVVSNQGYTKGARALAATNDVFLIHYSELPGFRQLAFAG